MRGTKAKHIRGTAEGAAVGMPPRKYRHAKHSRPGGIIIELHPMCTRALYQELKRHWCVKGKPFTGPQSADL